MFSKKYKINEKIIPNNKNINENIIYDNENIIYMIMKNILIFFL
jgi:hypothetical protein